jgi:hypothetical protein
MLQDSRPIFRRARCSDRARTIAAATKAVVEPPSTRAVLVRIVEADP